MKPPLSEPKPAAAVQGRPSMRWLVLSGLGLSAMSWVLVFWAADAEPFISFRWSEFALNVGLGTLLFVLFAIWGVACVRNLRRRAGGGTATTGLVCASVLWTLVHLFYLGTGVYGYLADMNNPRLRALRSQSE